MKNYKKGVIFMLAAVAAMLVVSPAMAGTYVADSGQKFTRGLANAATGWGEIPKNIVLESKAHNALVGVTYGTLKGVAQTVGRTVVGALELGTFFVPSHQVVQSTYVWDNTATETTYGL